jgi:hypothetical protein
MKKIFLKISLLFIFVFLFSLNSKAQLRYQLNKSRNETSWFAGINGGITSYYGNLAVFNRDPLLKIQEESKVAFGFTVGKSINKFLGARVFFTKGGLKAKNNEQKILYDAKLNSYGGQFLIQLYTLIGRMDYVPDYAIYGIVGFGMISAKPILSTIPTDDEPTSVPIDSLNYTNQLSSFDFNIGLGGSYAIFNQIDLNLELCYHLGFSDELDLMVSGKNDKFLHISLGAIYRFGFAGHKNTAGFRRTR